MTIEQIKDQLRNKLNKLMSTGDFEEADEFLTKLAETITDADIAHLFGDQMSDELKQAEDRMLAAQKELALAEEEFAIKQATVEVIEVKGVK